MNKETTTEEFTKECREYHRAKGANEEQWEYAERMMKLCDLLDSQAAINADLLAALKRDALLADIAIAQTQTSDLRNKLTEINMLRLAAIAKAKKGGE